MNRSPVNHDDLKPTADVGPRMPSGQILRSELHAALESLHRLRPALSISPGSALRLRCHRVLGQPGRRGGHFWHSLPRATLDNVNGGPFFVALLKTGHANLEH